MSKCATITLPYVSPMEASSLYGSGTRMSISLNWTASCPIVLHRALGHRRCLLLDAEVRVLWLLVDKRYQPERLRGEQEEVRRCATNVVSRGTMSSSHFPLHGYFRQWVQGGVEELGRSKKGTRQVIEAMQRARDVDTWEAHQIDSSEIPQGRQTGTTSACSYVSQYMEHVCRETYGLLDVTSIVLNC